MRWRTGKLLGAGLLALLVTATAFGTGPESGPPAPPGGEAGGCGSVCVPVPTTIKTTRWVYNCRCQEKCDLLPRCCLLGCLFHRCDEPRCSKPVSRTVLFKRKVTHECPGWKCEPPASPAP